MPKPSPRRDENRDNASINRRPTYATAASRLSRELIYSSLGFIKSKKRETIFFFLAVVRRRRSGDERCRSVDGRGDSVAVASCRAVKVGGVECRSVQESDGTHSPSLTADTDMHILEIGAEQVNIITHLNISRVNSPCAQDC